MNGSLKNVIKWVMFPTVSAEKSDLCYQSQPHQTFKGAHGHTLGVVGAEPSLRETPKSCDWYRVVFQWTWSHEHTWHGVTSDQLPSTDLYAYELWGQQLKKWMWDSPILASPFMSTFVHSSCINNSCKKHYLAYISLILQIKGATNDCRTCILGREKIKTTH